MRHRWAALSFVLALCAAMPRESHAQAPVTPEHGEAQAELGQNYPNPFNPETRIPFAVGDPPACTERGKLYRVTLKIYNLLSQLVAVPVLQGGSSNVAGGQVVENVALECDRYTAYWDGKDMNTSREVASGIYYYRLEVDGKKPLVRKMLVTK